MLRDKGLALVAGKEILLLKYGELIQTDNQKYNLTGLKTIEDIVERLIIESIEPLSDMNVPRGTIFADIGSGAGIPGIPLAIYHEQSEGILIESNHKKASFINSVIRECRLENVRVYHGRVENAARSAMRDNCDIIFSRAVGELYIVVEIGAPLLRQGGLMYIYSNEKPDNLPQHVMDHINDVGLSIIDQKRYSEFGIKEAGLLFLKSAGTDSIYPRKMSAIKRESQRLNLSYRE